MVVLCMFAARADELAVGARVSLTLLDLAVGIAFVLAALTATGPIPQRLLIGAVGPAWLVGSVFTWALSVHQAVLALALLAFPVGRIRGVLATVLAAAGAVVAFEIVPQLGVAALFALIAGVATFAHRRDRHARSTPNYPALAASAIAAVVWFAWWSIEHAAVASPLVDYDVVMLAVAVGFPLATRNETRSRAGFAERVLGVAGVPGLQSVLADVVNDPNLRIELWDESARAWPGGDDVTSSKAVQDSSLGRKVQHAVPVYDARRLLARVVSVSPSLADRKTADAAEAAVRLVVLHDQLQALHAHRVLELAAARARLLAVDDKERERIAARLQAEAGVCLQRALEEFAAARPGADPELATLVDLACAEVAAAAEEVDRIVAGVPPFALGAGRLREAVEALCARCPVPATLDAAVDAAASVEVETVLFYACSEALVNVAKHAGAASVSVHLLREVDRLVLRVQDDGVGGADAAGSGLSGLADRLVAVGGELIITGKVGRGTTVSAAVPWAGT